MNRTDKRDQSGYAFIRSQVVHSGITPSLRAIAKAVGYNSPRSAQLMLERLEKKGLLRRTDGVIRLSARRNSSTAERVIEVPLVGSIACGSPFLAEQMPEALVQVSTKIARPGHTYFLLRAKGSSMNRAGIRDGDLVLVRQQSSAQNGENVVALINDNATIKRFYHRGDVVVLKPDSTDKSHKPIVVSDEFVIQGVVVSSFPNLL